MIEKYFEELLAKSRRVLTENQEEMWDSRAEDFNNRQKKFGSNRYPESGLARLLQKGFLSEESEVLDIGCGPGRYIIPFAKTVKKVTGTDISSKMLDLLLENAKEAGLNNVEAVKLDWTNATGEEELFKERFDFVFSVQSPGVRDRGSLRKMMMVSRGYCMISNFVYRRDTLQERVKEELDLKNQHDPHNNRDRIQAIFNLLWLDGYTPELTYLHDSGESTLTEEEAFRYYGRRIRGLEEDQKEVVKEIISKMSSDGRISISSDSTMALLVWKV